MVEYRRVARSCSPVAPPCLLRTFIHLDTCTTTRPDWYIIEGYGGRDQQTLSWMLPKKTRYTMIDGFHVSHAKALIQQYSSTGSSFESFSSDFGASKTSMPFFIASSTGFLRNNEQRELQLGREFRVTPASSHPNVRSLRE